MADEGGWLPLTKFLVAWANAPYTVALGIVGLFTLLSASGLLGLLGGGEHGDGDHGDAADADGHDVEGHEADHDGGHDEGDDHDADQDDEADRGGLASQVLAPLGIGKLPFSLVWQVYGVVFAVTGLGLNSRYLDMGHAPPLVSLAWTMPTALAAGYAVVAALARVLGPVLASKDAEATSRAELVGRIGTVISTKIDADFGEIRVRDKTGHDLRVVCRLAPGHAAPREKQEIVVVDHDRDTGTLYVAPLEEDSEDSRKEREEGR